ncbi:AraC family transcriptional regulator [Shimia sp. Alg240-R146]|uniref:AraC family transcriptional regulator n=1 Tax=Shimia sp. Alg240-R146 TaxID=2993449 RepID=UPI0022E7FCA6|nr:AraC family transcriptional regulator [Shimia sp. Alg240-R146]
MPSKHDGFIRAVLVLPFIETARARGVDPRPILQKYGLTREDLRDPERTLHAEVIYGLTNRTAALCKDPHFGFHVAAAFDLRQWQPTKDALARARTVGDFYTRFLSVVPQQASSVRHSLEVTAQHATYSVNRNVQTQNLPEQVEGFGIGLHLRLLGLVLAGRWDGSKVTLLTPFPHTVPHTPMGAQVSSRNISGLALRFPSSWLILPFTQRDTENIASTTDAGADISIIEALRGVARPRLDDRTLSLTDYADELGIPPPRLKAALRLQDSTLSKEIKRLRIDVAEDMLKDSKLSVADIGERLGYHDQSHFTRFFRSQTGQTPLRFRRSNAD